MPDYPEALQRRLRTEDTIWLATVRPDGRPHLVPLWFVWHQQAIYLCVQPGSVKERNITHNPHVALALEDGVQPLICEGHAALVAAPWPPDVCAAFDQKYGWDICQEKTYTALLAVSPRKWLGWRTENNNAADFLRIVNDADDAAESTQA